MQSQRELNQLGQKHAVRISVDYLPPFVIDSVKFDDLKVIVNFQGVDPYIQNLMRPIEYNISPKKFDVIIYEKSNLILKNCYIMAYAVREVAPNFKDSIVEFRRDTIEPYIPSPLDNIKRRIVNEILKK